MPASFMAAISAMASPWLPTLAAPIGHTRVDPTKRALSTINRVIEALSWTGFVFGMQQTAVKPPRAADFVPVSMVSEDSCPGSRKCTWRSMKPGATIIPVASKTSASCQAENFPGAPISFTNSPSSRTSIAASVFDAGSINRPFFISNMLRVLALRNRLISNQQIENGHAHRHSVRNLFENAGLRAVGHLGRNFDTAIHRTGMQNKRARLGEFQPFGI